MQRHHGNERRGYAFFDILLNCFLDRNYLVMMMMMMSRKERKMLQVVTTR